MFAFLDECAASTTTHVGERNVREERPRSGQSEGIRPPHLE